MILNGLIYEWISVIALLIPSTVMNFCLDFILTGREERGTKKRRIFCWVTSCSLLIWVKCFAPINSAYIILMNPLLLSVIYIFMVLYFYSDILWIKITHTSMFVIQSTLADIIIFVIFGEVPGFSYSSRAFANPFMAERCIVVGLLSILFNIVYITLVILLKKKGKDGANPAWIGIIVPTFLIILGLWTMREAEFGVEQKHIYMGVMTIFMCVQFVLAMVYLSRLQKKEAQREADKLSRIMMLEKIRYEQIESRREEMEKIRHDYINILTSVLFLMKNDRAEDAKNVLQDLLDRVDDSEEPVRGMNNGGS